ncbi:MAG: HD domain-containing phosphohydrolase [Sulfuricellaceae bacterium]
MNEQASSSLLFVDDEPNILSALKRLFRPLGYQVFTAESGDAGLEILRGGAPIDLVVSDMRMPGMGGAEFLERVRQQWPDVVRILLTGYADMESTVAAINRGEIYRYIAKPWDDHEVVLIVRQALERKFLEEERRRLVALTQRQNAELKELNGHLEERVKARTEELRRAMDSLKTAHEQLKKTFLTSIQVFANLVEMREGSMAGHSKRVAEMAHMLARRLRVAAADAQDVLVAALLHDIGKVGLPDHLLTKAYSNLTVEERAEVVKHPARGAAALMALEQIRPAAKIIQGHHERYDGQGFPDGLAALAIPLGARILAVANDYDNLIYGRLVARALNQREALEFIVEGRGKRYDPQVVDAFVEIMSKKPAVQKAVVEKTLTPNQLSPGMVLSRDLFSSEGLLLLAKGYVLDQNVIEQLRGFELLEGRTLVAHVRAEGVGGGVE